MRLVIIGSGNVANVLAEKFQLVGHQILQVAGRNADRVKELAARVRSTAISEIGEISRDADVYLIAVSDDAVSQVAERLPVVSGVVAHSAGSVNKHVLEQFSSRFGVFYPLQSLKNGVNSPAVVPILVDGNEEGTTATLRSLAESISIMVQVAGDEQRLRLHLAATMVNNFSNHLFALAYNFCEAEHVVFDLVIPLIKNTVDKLGGIDPALLQTGPASRRDIGTIEKHLALLQEYPELKAFYTRFSDSIMDSPR